MLTSDEDASRVRDALDAAIVAGCDGVVCSMHEVAAVKPARREMIAVVPGVRLASNDRNDQRRIGTPDAVAAAGADVLVVGRAVTAADDPRASRRRCTSPWHAQSRDSAPNACAQARAQLRPRLGSLCWPAVAPRMSVHTDR